MVVSYHFVRILQAHGIEPGVANDVGNLGDVLPVEAIRHPVAAMPAVPVHGSDLDHHVVRVHDLVPSRRKRRLKRKAPSWLVRCPGTGRVRVRVRVSVRVRVVDTPMDMDGSLSETGGEHLH